MAGERIVSLVPSLTELVCALGLGERLVGRTGYCIHPIEALRRVPKVGGTKTVNLQKIRALAPTHLIVNVDENEKPTVDALREFIPHVIVTHPLVVDDNFGLYRRLGDVFGASAQAEALCDRLARVLALVDAVEREPIDVAYLIWNDPWMSITSETYIASMLARVGLRARVPAGDRRYPSVEPGELLALGVRAVLLSSEPCRFRPADRQRLRQAMTHAASSTAATVPILAIDGEMTSWYGPRAIEGLAYLLAYRQRLERRLAHRSRRHPLARSGAWPVSRLAGLCLALSVAAGLVACSSAPTAGGGAIPPSAASGSGETAGQPPAAGRGRYYRDDGPGDRPLEELERLPDAVPRAEALHPWANRPYVVFGRQYEPMTRLEPFRERGTATWYGRRYHERPTSTGERYDMYGMSAAHPRLPLPSYARVTNLRNGRSVIVRINDRGPFLHDRVIDLSLAAAAKLGFARQGSAEVEVELITQFAPPSAALAGTPPAAASPLAASSPPPSGPAPISSPAPSSNASAATGSSLGAGVSASAAVTVPRVASSAVAPGPAPTGAAPALPVAQAQAVSTPAQPAPPVPAGSVADTARVPAPRPEATFAVPQGGPRPIPDAASSSLTPASITPAGITPAGINPPGASAAASSGAPSTVKAAPAAQRFVQIGAYGSREGAQAARQRLAPNLGSMADAVVVREEGRFFKLLAGPFAHPDQAREAALRIRSATGLEVFQILR